MPGETTQARYKLVRAGSTGRQVGRIVEVEAYDGLQNGVSHRVTDPLYRSWRYPTYLAQVRP